MSKLSAIALFTLAFLAFQQPLLAQIGLKAGINYASLSESASEDNLGDYSKKSVLGLQAGIVAEVKLIDRFVIQPEFLFIQKGGKSEYIINDNNKTVTRVIYNYVEIPVLAKLKLGNTEGEGLGVYVLGGPFAGFALNGRGETELTLLGVTTKDEFDIDYSDEDNDQKRIDWGVSFGAGVSIGHFFVDARYNLGINNLLDDDADNSNDNKPYTRTRGIGLTAGFLF